MYGSLNSSSPELASVGPVTVILSADEQPATVAPCCDPLTCSGPPAPGLCGRQQPALPCVLMSVSFTRRYAVCLLA